VWIVIGVVMQVNIHSTCKKVRHPQWQHECWKQILRVGSNTFRNRWVNALPPNKFQDKFNTSSAWRKKTFDTRLDIARCLCALLPWALYRKGRQRLPGFGGQVVVAEVQVF
jgi:hypothetical protein